MGNAGFISSTSPTIKGLIYPYYAYNSTVTEWGQYIQARPSVIPGVQQQLDFVTVVQFLADDGWLRLILKQVFMVLPFWGEASAADLLKPLGAQIGSNW